jgi:hypothetical protein
MKLKDFYAKANQDLEEKFFEIDKRREAERKRLFDSFTNLIKGEIRKSTFADVMDAANALPDPRDKGIILAMYARENPGTLEAEMTLNLAEYYFFVSVKKYNEGKK